MKQRPLRFVELATGCFVCMSLLPNQDGYLRKTWGSARRGQRVAEMFHRFIYRAHYGEIPSGLEVDHICGIRLCCNPDHLRLLRRSTHASITNMACYADRLAAAKRYWLKYRPTAVRLAELFDVSSSAASAWVRSWGGGRGK